MTISELKADAKRKLSGKLGTAVAIMLVYVIVVAILEIIGTSIHNEAFSFIINIIVVILNVPLSFGLLASMIKLSRGEKVGIFDFFTVALENVYNAWKVVGRTILKMIIPTVLIILSILIMVFSVAYTATQSVVLGTTSSSSSGSGIIFIIGIIAFIAAYVYFFVKYLLYSLSNYILFDNPEYTGKEIVEKSAELMNGNRWKLFKLSLSFIGWYLLIGVAMVVPIVGPILAIIGALLLSPYITFASINFYEDLNGVVKETPTDSNNSESTVE